MDDLTAGYHLDVFDGHNVRELLFGPDLVAALREATDRIIEVHLNVTEPHVWIDRFADAGADVITVQAAPCPDVAEALDHIRHRGCRPSLGLEVGEPVEHAVGLLEHTDRILVMGTVLGVRSVEQDPATAARVASLADARHPDECRFDIVVDGGIRRHTVPGLAAAGADGVVPGSLVFGTDPRRALTELQALPVGRAADPLAAFWSGPERARTTAGVAP